MEILAKLSSENPNPVMRISAGGVIVYANKAAKPLLDHWNRKPQDKLPENYSRLVSKIKGTGVHECVEITCKDRMYSTIFASIEDADYVNLYARDITEAKKGEMKLIKANEVLKEHDRLKSEFVSTVSHELRTPLCIFKNIISNAMAGVMGKLNNKLYESLKTADRSIDRLSRIIGDFLDISKIEAGSLELNKKTFVVQPVVKDTVDTLRTLAQAKGIQIAFTACRQDLVINADQDRIIQVVTNLVGNAIKFIPANGHIDVEINDADSRVELVVRDDGPGLSKDEAEKIFDRFVQVHQISGPGEHGTGLGLTITKELVELHGGRIWVDSVLGEGCSFHCVLPKHNPKDQPEPQLAESAKN
jgi:signal transduction histidine kinase